MNEQTLKTIKQFEVLPSTEEKDSIKNQYLADDIDSFEFFCLAGAYIYKVIKGNK
jgi:hypothetical protein